MKNIIIPVLFLISHSVAGQGYLKLSTSDTFYSYVNNESKSGDYNSEAFIFKSGDVCFLIRDSEPYANGSFKLNDSEISITISVDGEELKYTGSVVSGKLIIKLINASSSKVYLLEEAKGPSVITPSIIEIEDEDEIEEDFDLSVNLDEMEDDFDIQFEEEPEEEVFTIVEEPSIPVNGYNEFYKFVSENLNNPDSNIKGTLYAAFVVGNDGMVRDYEILKGLSPEHDKEAIRVLKLTNWTIPRQRGKAVAQKITIPVRFN